MRRSSCWRLFIGSALAMIPQPTLHAEWGPSFSAGASSWKATDIVVVNDGVVQAVWKGDLKPGVRLPAEGLKNSRKDPTVYYGLRRGKVDPTWLPPNPVRTVTEKRRVLFLIRGDGERWIPAAEDFGFSTVWIEDGKCFSVQQISYSGPALIRPMYRHQGKQWEVISEAHLKAEVEAHCDTQARFVAAERVEDPTERAKALVKFLLESDGQSLGYRVYRSLTECGEPAWPVIRLLLFDEQHLAIHTKLMSVGIQIDPKAIVPEMERIVQEETEHWRTIPRDEVKELYRKPPLSHHFERLDSALLALKRAEYDDSKNIVASLRQDWDSSDVLRVLGMRHGETVSPVLIKADAILGNPPAPLKLPEDGQHSIKIITEIADKAVEDLIPRGDYMLAVASARMMQFSAPSLTKYPEYQAELDKQIGRIRDALREATGDRHPQVWKVWEIQIEKSPPLLRLSD